MKITLKRVKIILKRVEITLVRVKITLMRVESTRMRTQNEMFVVFLFLRLFPLICSLKLKFD
jgi:hypothetical protein